MKQKVMMEGGVRKKAFRGNKSASLTENKSLQIMIKIQLQWTATEGHSKTKPIKCQTIALVSVSLYSWNPMSVDVHATYVQCPSCVRCNK